MTSLASLIRDLPGPILVIGASGFVGSNLFRAVFNERTDVIGTIFSGDSWRLKGIPARNLSFLNRQDANNVQAVFARYSPKVVFDCASFGAYSFEQDVDRIHATNYMSFVRILEMATEMDLNAYVHAGSSSEYGLNAGGSSEDAALVPNSHYAVSKAAAGNAINFFGKVRGLPVANLRLYSLYGPYEDSSRLVPVLCEHAIRGKLPLLAKPEVERDFVHVDDAVEAFVRAALFIAPDIAGESFNIGTGVRTSLADLASLSRELFAIEEEPVYNITAGRAWDVDTWFARPEKAERKLGWKARIALAEGLKSTRDWWQKFLENNSFEQLTKKQQPKRSKNSISAIVACYRDGQAIPIMHERLVKVFESLQMDYEIIFVNDCSPDNSEEVIRKLSATDPHVMGITHSRNFGSQAAFRSGMGLASKEACVLMDGDLQDPPEMIKDFVVHWREGAEVVYGRRVKREMPRWLELCYKAFYRLFAALSEMPIPKDAGDFSLLDRSVVHQILQCQERDAFLRGLRAYVGFTQVGVDYVRPERMFGRSTNNWIKNIGWAKKAIFSFSRVPLHLLSAVGAVTFSGTCLMALYAMIMRLVAPNSAPQGITFLALLIMFFGTASLLGLGLLGEYLGKVLVETKARPPFIRQHVIMDGNIHPEDDFRRGRKRCDG